MMKNFPWIALAALGLTAATAPLRADTSIAQVQASLLAEARQWVSKNEGLRMEEINFYPLDARLDLQNCPEPYAVDLPFGNSQTLRLLCAPLNQQVFLKRIRTGTPFMSASPKAENQVAGTHTSYGDPTVRSSTQTTHQPLVRPLKQARNTPATSSIQFESSVLVATSNLSPGQTLGPELFRQEHRQLNQNPAQFYSEFKGLEFLELVRPIKAGSPIRKQDLKRSTLIRKGEPVQHVISSITGLTLSIKLEAAEDGFAGEKIRLRNPESGKIVMGRVTGRNLSESL
jgi:flagella basal body P-ring formation protein FlgA